VKELERDRELALVFVRTKRGAERLVQKLKRHDVKAAALHGDMTQERASARWRVSQRRSDDARGDGRCRARPRSRQHHARDQLRSARVTTRPTCTASAAPAVPAAAAAV
jgi:hypothetical protein